tara:strand:- start:886 stop:1035 length:150 start_codon:yes stop_codon:yes gene_type:complete
MKIKKINPVARAMLQNRRSPQVVESKKIYNRNKKGQKINSYDLLIQAKG